MPADDIANGLAAAASHPAVVQVINQGPGIWGNVATGLITGLLTGGVALTGIWLTHRLTLEREKLASENTLKKERYFIATELVFLLERFAEACIAPASDTGLGNNEMNRMEFSTNFPKLKYASVTGDWRTLPPRLIYRLRELTVMQEESARIISDSFEDDDPVEPVSSFEIRQYQAARLGMKASIQAGHLRRLCSMPSGVRLHDQKTAAGALWKLWLKHRSGEVARLKTHKMLREFADKNSQQGRGERHDRPRSPG